MQGIQMITPVSKTELVAKAQAYAADAYRLVQIHCTKTPAVMDLIYSFEKQDLTVENLRLSVMDGETLPSISGAFTYACLYENEIHDLFGLIFSGMAIDFKGTFYETTIQFPFRDVPSPNPKA